MSSLILGNTLVVEDNFLIAIDAELHLRALGAEAVHLAADVPQGLAVIERFPLSFALLDMSLDSGTSGPVAEELTRRGVRFAFASGHGEESPLARSFPEVPIVPKPYGVDAIRAVLSRLAGYPA